MRLPLNEKDLPDYWYNIIPDLDFAIPQLMSPSGYPLSENDLEPIATHEIIEQEMEVDINEISIPKEVKKLYSNWRPTPIYRAENLEKELGTPARIYYKYEGGGISIGHEANTAFTQAYYAIREGVNHLITASANGEWGVSLAMACNQVGIKCRVYMVKSSYDNKVYGRYLMEMLGAEVIPSPSERTKAGKKALADDPESAGNLSIGLGEAFEDTYKDEASKFCWGTVMNHVILHQTVVGIEAANQARSSGAYPDIIIASAGGGSGFGGLVFPIYRERKKDTRFIAVESAASPTLTKGTYAYDRAGSSGLSVMLKMYTLGNGLMQSDIRAGGMRYHGVSPLVSAMYRNKQIEARAYSQTQAFDAAIMFAKAEGFIPSLECSYAVRAVIDEALSCKTNKLKRNILFLLDANSNFDIDTYRDFIEGNVQGYFVSDSEIKMALEKLSD